jgi:hypothetical protein
MKIWIMLLSWILGMIACEACAKPFERLKARCVGGVCKAPVQKDVVQKDATQKPKAPIQKADEKPTFPPPKPKAEAAGADAGAIGDRLRKMRKARDEIIAETHAFVKDYEAKHNGQKPTAQQVKDGVKKKLGAKYAGSDKPFFDLLMQLFNQLLPLLLKLFGL